jgi:hypothetical protein
MAQDMLKAEVEVGDRAVYVTSGRYTQRGIIEVLEVKKRARVRWLQVSPRRYSDDDPTGFWIEPGSLFLVEKFKGAIPE